MEKCFKKKKRRSREKMIIFFIDIHEQNIVTFSLTWEGHEGLFSAILK